MMSPLKASFWVKKRLRHHHKTVTLKDVATRVKSIISERMIQSAYVDVEDIVTKAIDAYLEEHPEMRKGKL